MDTMQNCAICGNEAGTSPATVDGKPVCAACNARIEAYAERVESRLEGLQARAERTRIEASRDIERAHGMASVIPFGQPILVGHHSEGRDRRYRDRIEKTYRRGFDALQKAERQQRRVDAAADNRAISSDDPAAVLKLQAKIDAAEAEQARMVEINKAVRKLAKPYRMAPTTGHGRTMEQMNADFHGEQARKKAHDDANLARAPELAAALGITEAQALHLLTPDFCGRTGVPDYALKNNSANVRRMKARLEELKRQTARAGEQAAPPALPWQTRRRDARPAKIARVRLEPGQHGLAAPTQ